MAPLLTVLLCFFVYFLAYRFYSKFLADKIFSLRSESGTTPAHTLRDNVDYLPTKPSILFGHHYASIAGLAPILGPAVAVIWGWLPAMVWVVFGAVFIGCVHDFGSVVVSIRNQGKSIGQVAEDLLGHRARSLFHAIIFFLVALAMGVFVLVIAGMYSAPPNTDRIQTETSATSDKTVTPEELQQKHDEGKIGSSIQLRSHFPEAVLPSAAIMVFAMIMGFLTHKKSFHIRWPTIISLALLFPIMYLAMDSSFMAWIGLADPGRSPTVGGWKLILLAYAFLASVTPVWLLLQSRDYINSFLLYLGVILIYIGFFTGSFQNQFSGFNAEMIRSGSVGLDLVPFVFITIACGAASGFHSLVSSGTTAKQIDREKDARVIGYGAMLGESLLGLTAVIACTIGFASAEEWNSFYRNWAGIQGLAPQVGAYVYGAGRFMSQIGIPMNLAQGFIALVVVSFALTSLDSATRLLRYNIEEIAISTKSEWIQKFFGNRYIASFIACAAIGLFAFLEIEQDGKVKPAGLALWKLFGTTNQLLAGLALLVITVYLYFNKKKIIYTFIPMLFVLSMTLWAMVQNFMEFLTSTNPNYLLAGVGGTLIVLTFWLLIEAVLAYRRYHRS